MYSFDLIENIYFPHTKENVEEILSCYFAGNYRSAIVMLYSTVISDLCLKLDELWQVENDSIAHKILEDVTKNKADEESKSKWEHKLVDLMLEHEYITPKIANDIFSLYNERCFAAHPTMNEGFSLTKPKKESTLAHFVNMLTEIFVEPPFFNSNIASKITDDLATKKEILIDDEKLHNYLNKRYLSRMTQKSFLAVFRAFWKFCFNSIDDVNCQKNFDINFKALIYLVMYKNDILSCAKTDGFAFPVFVQDANLDNLFLFCATLPHVYDYLSDENKAFLEKRHNYGKNILISWFIFKNFNDFAKYLSSNFGMVIFSVREIISCGYMRMFEQKCFHENKINLYNEACIKMFENVSDFYDVPVLFNVCIRPVLPNLDVKQIERIIKASSTNRTILDCWDFNLSRRDEIAKEYMKKAGRKISKAAYPSFNCSNEYLNDESNATNS